jgi:hypothetical protein
VDGKIVKNAARGFLNYLKLPLAAKVEHFMDSWRLSKNDPGIEASIDEGIGWLCRAQDNSISQDGGVAWHYHLIDGWGSSYPETTGYIIPTMLAYADLRKEESVRQRAKRMLDWLVSIQLPCGGFQGGQIDSKPVVPVTFNTGQILTGLASGAREFGDGYLESMRRAADWLVETQDVDGCWRKHPTPFAAPGEKAYETHVAWGLLEAARIEPGKPYAKAALRNVHWALGLQKENGWFEKCCLTDSTRPLTHTLGYALRGILEAYQFTGDTALLKASQKTAEGLLTALREDGFLPGRLKADWKGTVKWSCLTGSMQIAVCWMLLYQRTGEVRYKEAALSVNKFVRRTMKINGPTETRGGIKGSFPIYGNYCEYDFPNWATKFFLDSNMLEHQILNLTD